MYKAETRLDQGLLPLLLLLSQQSRQHEIQMHVFTGNLTANHAEVSIDTEIFHDMNARFHGIRGAAAAVAATATGVVHHFLRAVHGDVEIFGDGTNSRRSGVPLVANVFTEETWSSPVHPKNNSGQKAQNDHGANGCPDGHGTAMSGYCVF